MSWAVSSGFRGGKGASAIDSRSRFMSNVGASATRSQMLTILLPILW